jgi:hypothetical protein
MIAGAPLPGWLGTAAIAIGLLVSLPFLAVTIWRDRGKR